MIVIGFSCDAPGCDKRQQFPLAMLSRDRNRHSTFFDTALSMNRANRWRVEGNGRELPNWDCKVFCPDHIHLHRDFGTGK